LKVRLIFYCDVEILYALFQKEYHLANALKYLLLIVHDFLNFFFFDLFYGSVISNCKFLWQMRLEGVASNKLGQFAVVLEVTFESDALSSYFFAVLI
jgi:hypothetical protein